MSEQSYNVDDPLVFHIEGAGAIYYFEFDEGIWVQDVCSEKPGKGALLAYRFMRYAKKKGKDIYGYINPDGTGMDAERMKRWYALLGGEMVPTANFEAMRLEVRKNGRMGRRRRR